MREKKKKKKKKRKRKKEKEKEKEGKKPFGEGIGVVFFASQISNLLFL